MMHSRTLLLTLALATLAACGTAPELPEDFETWVLELEDRTLQDLAEQLPNLDSELDRAVGYAIFANQATKVPVVGKGEGLGVAVDRANGQRQYLSVTHFDVGGGLGALAYRLVIVFFDQDDFERLSSGTMHVGASIDAGTTSETVGFSGSSLGASRDGTRLVYVLSDSGATATWTVRLVRFLPLDPD